MCDFIGKTSRYKHGPTPIKSTSGVNYNYLKIVHTSLYHFPFKYNLSKTDRQTNNTISIGFGFLIEQT